MKKTPLQQLIEYMGQNQYFIGNDLYAKQKELLEEEKQMVVDAYRDGRSDQRCDMMPEYYNRTAEEYVNQNFGQ